MNDRDIWTIEAMDEMGGSFVQSLAALARHADAENLELIKQTWSAYWAEYEEWGKKLEKQRS